MQSSVLIAVAHELEARYLTSRDDYRVLVTGVGMVSAATTLSSELAVRKPSHVVLLGSCGAYPNRDGIHEGDVITSSEFHLLDSNVITGGGAFPDALKTAIHLPSPVVTHDIASVPIGSTLSVTTDDSVARHFAHNSPCAVENLEAFAVAYACKQHDVALTTILYITNIVGSQGREHWRANCDRAARVTAEYIRPKLGAMLKP